jgi:hypothetical protein
MRPRGCNDKAGRFAKSDLDGVPTKSTAGAPFFNLDELDQFDRGAMHLV